MKADVRERIDRLFFRPKRLGLFAIFAVSVLTGLSFLFLIPDSLRHEEFSDYKGFYEPVARNIAAGNGITLDGNVATFQGPGLPVILGFLFFVAQHTQISEELLLSLSILVCNGLVAVIVLSLAEQLWQRGLAFLATLLWIFYPLNLWFTQHLSSELPFMVVVYLGILFLWKARQDDYSLSMGLLCGFSLGIAALIRPIGIGLSVLAAMILWFSTRPMRFRTRVRIALSPIAASILVTAPWITWASYQRGEFVLVASSGAGTVMDGLTYAVDDGFPSGAVPNDVAGLQERLLKRNQEKPQTMSEIASLLLSELRQDPVAVLKLFTIKFARNWYGTYSGERELMALVMHVPFFALAFVGSLLTWWQKERRWYLVTNWLIFIYFLAMSTLVNTNVRYIAPMMGLVLIFSPGVMTVLKALASSRRAISSSG